MIDRCRIRKASIECDFLTGLTSYISIMYCSCFQQHDALGFEVLVVSPMTMIHSKHQGWLGLETEYGWLREKKDFRDSGAVLDSVWELTKSKLPTKASWYGGYNKEQSVGFVLKNGARIYRDVSQIEYATPTVLGARRLIAAIRAGNEIVNSVSPNFVRNNIDPRSRDGDEFVEFGSHLNRQVSVDAYEKRELMMPAFVALQVLGGGGVVTPRYGPFRSGVSYAECGVFHISARSPVMHDEFSVETMSNRAIITKRDEHHGDPKVGKRLHLAFRDALTGEVPEFLSIFFIDIVCKGIEDGLFDDRESRKRLDYLKSSKGVIPIVQDMHAIAQKLGGWKMGAMTHKEMGDPISVLSFYLDRCSAQYEKEADSWTQWAFVKCREVLKALSKLTGEVDSLGISKDNYDDLIGLVEWVTAKASLDVFVKDLKIKEPTLGGDALLNYLISIDQDFHSVNRLKNIYINERGQWELPRVVTDREIRFAAECPSLGRARSHAVIARMARKTDDPVVVDWKCCTIGRDHFELGEPNNDDPELRRRLVARLKQTKNDSISVT